MKCAVMASTVEPVCSLWFIDIKKEQNQDHAAADSDGLKKWLKVQRVVHLLFNATLAICGVLESLPVQAAPARWASL